MTTAATIIAELILDASGFQGDMDKATKSADAFAQKMQKVGKDMQRVGAGMTVALTLPIVAFGAAAVKEAMASEAAIADLEQTLKSTGSAAGVTSKEIQDYANKMQMLTKFSDDEIISGNAMLLTFTKIGKEVFPAASDATLDLAQKFGMDLSQASVMLGKALNDPVAGVGALRRIGVALSAQQEQQIKDFMAVNDIASAQKVILDELAVEVGGMAQAFGGTAAGKMAIFNNQLGQLKEALGNAIIPTLISFMQAITPLIQSLAAAPPWVQKLVVGLLALVAAAGPLISILGTLATVIGAFGTGGALAGVGTFITATLLPALGSLFTFITATAIPAIFAFVAANIAWIAPLLLIAATVYLVYLAFKNNFGGITTTVKNLWGIIKWAFSGIVKAISTVIMATLKMIATFAKVKLPKALTPGSPTPFEMGLRGITSAMDTLSNRSLPNMQTKLNASAAPSMAGSGSNSQINYQDNRRFNSGISATDRKNINNDTKKTLTMAMGL